MYSGMIHIVPMYMYMLYVCIYTQYMQNWHDCGIYIFSSCVVGMFPSNPGCVKTSSVCVCVCVCFSF